MPRCIWRTCGRRYSDVFGNARLPIDLGTASYRLDPLLNAILIR